MKETTKETKVTLKEKVKERVSLIKALLFTALVLGATEISMASAELKASKVLGGFIGVIVAIISLVGYGCIAIGIGMFIFSSIQDDNVGKSKAMFFGIGGIAAIAAETIMKKIFDGSGVSITKINLLG